jgi:hypothetical protein
MNADTILQLADNAARHVQKRYSLEWTREDCEDTCQEAAAGILHALRVRPQMPERYYQTAAIRAVLCYAFRRTSVHAQYGEDGEAIDPLSCGWTQPLTDDDIPAVRRVLSAIPRKPGARGGPKTRDQIAVARDLIILEALSRGHSRAEIGARLSIPKSRVDPYIAKLRHRLAAIAAERI